MDRPSYRDARTHLKRDPSIMAVSAVLPVQNAIEITGINGAGINGVQSSVSFDWNVFLIRMYFWFECIFDSVILEALIFRSIESNARIFLNSIFQVCLMYTVSVKSGSDIAFCFDIYRRQLSSMRKRSEIKDTFLNCFHQIGFWERMLINFHYN